MRNAQEKFNKVIKEGITPILKSNNFRRKGLNFYKDLGDIGHAINIQKDKNSTKDEIRFMINIGIFSKPYWFVEYNYDNEISHPVFPKEPVSILRKRIGDLKYGYDYWYELETQIIERKVMSECAADCEKYILPYLNSILTQDDLVKYLESNLEESSFKYRLFTLLGEIGNKDKAQILYQKLMSESEHSSMDWIVAKGKKYNLT